MNQSAAEVLPTGVRGLDDVLLGGLMPRGIYFIGGAPGTGKTTLGLQFLIEGRDRGEKTLFVTLSQSESDLNRVAASHGFDLDGIEIEAVPAVQMADAPGLRQTVLNPDDADLSAAIATLNEIVGQSKAERVVIDSLFEIRLLAHDALTYRRELLLLRNVVASIGATALMLDYSDGDLGDRQIEGLVNGAIMLEQDNPDYGTTIRRLHVSKMRGRKFIEGHHNLTIRTGGLAVFPRVVPGATREHATSAEVASGIPGLDQMMAGGLALGTTCLITGESGTGKSTLSTAYASAAAEGGSTAAMFLFEERLGVFRQRSTDLGFDIREMEEDGRLHLRHFDPAEKSPGEFLQSVVDLVEKESVDVVVIDSLSGALAAHPAGSDMITQMQSLLSYLSRQGVLTIVTLTEAGRLGGELSPAIQIGCFADSAILLRNERVDDELRRTLLVLKKRQGDHETRVRTLLIGDRSVDVVSASEARRSKPHLSVM
ncbi:ATPase domain-containing protein [Tropicimonas sp. IMCC34011]|uniref:ATPase domain-containing protein n=1 Tax=Tropicimonas sp. IMCC34011 TaxID=2248759 RepID=UPI000E276454|nr:ATPase domain-containing protein [Tropicimonas sp. IMCC34011]